MMETTIPSGLPTLEPGAHGPHQGKACIMEYVSLIAGEDWGDSPKCVFSLIAGAARTVNDRGDYKTRQRLLSLVPRLLNANLTGRQMVARGLTYTRVEHRMLCAVEEYAREHSLPYGGWVGHPTSIFSFVIAYEAEHGRGDRVLVAMLDAFDKIVGKRPTVEVPNLNYITATQAISSKDVQVPALV